MTPYFHRRLILVIAKVTYPYDFGGIRKPHKLREIKLL